MKLSLEYLKLVDQSSRDLFPRTQEESIWKTSLSNLDILSRSGDIRKVGRCKKSTEILHVFGPRYFLGEDPQIFGSYPAIPARFRSCGTFSRRSAEEPRRCGCLKTSRVKHKPGREQREKRLRLEDRGKNKGRAEKGGEVGETWDGGKEYNAICSGIDLPGCEGRSIPDVLPEIIGKLFYCRLGAKNKERNQHQQRNVKSLVAYARTIDLLVLTPTLSSADTRLDIRHRPKIDMASYAQKIKA